MHSWSGSASWPPPTQNHLSGHRSAGSFSTAFVSHFAELMCLRGATTNNKECTSMDARLNLFDNATAGKMLKYITAAGKVITDSTLPAATHQLVALRASQINCCGFCTDMHTKDAAHPGETSTRLNLVAAWREARAFTDSKRAALGLTEQGAPIAHAGGGVTDECEGNTTTY